MGTCRFLGGMAGRACGGSLGEDIDVSVVNHMARHHFCHHFPCLVMAARKQFLSKIHKVDLLRLQDKSALKGLL